jgi:hypothetical protein
MIEDGLQMMVQLTVANRRADKGPALDEASGRLDALRITLRLSRGLGFLSNGGYEDLSRDIDEVGRMLGGWIKYDAAPRRSVVGPAVPASSERPAQPALRAAFPPLAIKPSVSTERRRRTGGVRYTMTSPTIEKYLRLKLTQPRAVVFVTVGAFCQTFFEDAVFCGQALHLAVRNLGAESESEKILTCGIPKAKLEKYIDLLQQAEREVHVE